MARNKMSLQGELFEPYMAKLDELGNSAAMKRGVEGALKASKQYVNPLINAAMVSSNLPAGGRYSTGDTKQAIDNEMAVEWDGTIGGIKVGFDFKKGGLTSIFLMYGTPKMQPVAGLKNAIYGAKTQREVKQIQADALEKVIKRVMEG